MRSLYWKIFISFWLTTIVLILTTTWVTSLLTHRSSTNAHEKEFMNSYATAAVITFESGSKSALNRWLAKISHQKDMHFYLLNTEMGVLGDKSAPKSVKTIARNLADEQLDEGLLKYRNLIISHEIVSTTGNIYRLAAITDKPLYPLTNIPWSRLSIRVLLGVFFSGLICYLLSYYLTQPLRLLGQAAKSIGRGELSTRVGRFKGHRRDEIAALSADFDRMAEQLEAIMEAKERLLGDISHELRSPLARLQIAIEIAKKSHPDPSQFQRMEKECQRLNQLIGEILEYARLEKSPYQCDFTIISLSTIITRLTDDARYEAQLRDIDIKVTDQISATQFGNKRLLHRAFDNILRNAIRYSPDKGTIWINLNETVDNIKITILDQGPGVPEKDIIKLTAPFYRVDQAREKKTGGYGLGLSIAMEAIRLHKGTISFKNHSEQGLEVTVSLPNISIQNP